MKCVQFVLLVVQHTRMHAVLWAKFLGGGNGNDDDDSDNNTFSVNEYFVHYNLIYMCVQHNTVY